MARTITRKKDAPQPVRASRAAISKAQQRRPEAAAEELLGELRRLIEQARAAVAQTVNAGLVLLNWHIGQRIREEILGEGRAEYGEQIVATLTQQLTAEYRRSYSRANLFNMIRFVEVFPAVEIVPTVSRQLSWLLSWKSSKGNIRVSEHRTELPPHELLEAKLHEAIRLAGIRKAERK